MGNLAQELDFWHFEDNLMVYKDGSLGAGFKLSGFDLTCATDESINQLMRQLENLLVSIDEKLKLQFFYQLNSDVSDLINEHKNLSHKIQGPYQKLAQARCQFYQRNQDQKNYFVPQIYLFVRSQTCELKKQGFFSTDKDFKKISYEEFEQRKDKMDRSIKQINSLLVAAKLNPKLLSTTEWFNLVFEYLNLDRSEKIGIPTYKEPINILDPSIGEQLTLTDFIWSKEGITLGNYKFRTVSLALLPEGHTFASMAQTFTSLPFHFWMSQSIHLLDQSKEKTSLELKRRIAHSMASGSQNVSDLESENKLGQIEGLLSNLLEGSEKLVSSDLTIILWGRSEAELNDKTDEILRAFRSMNQAEGIQETLATKDVFLKSIPGCCHGLRHKKMKTSNATHFMPLFASWAGNSRPVCLLPTRDGRLFSLDPYADHLPSWNGIVFGGSGSGKSYTVVQLMSMFYGKVNKNSSQKINQPRIVWIDNGASSKRLIEVLDGEFLDLNLDSQLCLNMFDLKEGETQPSPDRVRTILAVLEMILKDEDRKALGKREKALLEEQIHKVYELNKDKTPTLSDYKKLLNQHPDPQLKHFAEILFSWTGSSAYGKILDGQTNVKLSKDLVSIEVQHLSNYSDLKDVLLLLLTSYIQDVASSDIEREYLLIIDEAERLFQSELARQVVITCYRTWRKFKSGIWCLSQNYKDFMADKALKDALLTNTTSVIILRQRKIDWDDFKKTFDFNDTQVARIKSLQIKKGEYSEFYYLQDENESILRLVPEPLSHWISTSDANDKMRIAQIERENPHLTKLEVLERLSRYI
ncbi:MAG: TraC family protein [Bdellovibrionota bacterium]